MDTVLNDQQKDELRKQLQEQMHAIKEDLRIELEQSDNEQYIELAGQVHDVEDEAVADLLKDVNLAVIDAHIKQLREIEAAQRRMDTGLYGTCIDCGGEIGYPRLRAYPTASRCRECQEKHEATYAGPGHPTL